jgi:zinc-ribbon domain
MAAKDQVRCPQCGVPNDPGALFCSRCGASLNRPGYTGRRQGRVSLAGFTMALALLIALGVTVFVLYTIVSRSLTTSTDTSVTAYSGAPGTLAVLGTSTTVPPSTSTTSGTVKGSLLVRPTAATASSSLASTSLTDFRPTNLLDGDATTAWVEGAKGTGAGSWVKLEFDHAVSLARIEIANGYQADDTRFADFVRVKSLELDYSDGTRQVVQLLDEQGLQVIEPATGKDSKPMSTGWIKLVILSVYPAYKFPQAALSEVRVYEAVQ